MHTCSLLFNVCLNDTAVEPRALLMLTGKLRELSWYSAHLVS